MTDNAASLTYGSELRVGFAAHVLGALISIPAFATFASIAVSLLESESLFAGFAIYGYFGAFAALFVGLPFGYLLSMVMRSVLNQWVHVLAFGIFGLVLGVLVMLWLGDASEAVFVFSLATALGAAVGRLAMWSFAQVKVVVVDHPEPELPADHQ